MTHSPSDFFGVVTFFSIVFLATAPQAEIYKWVDKHGTTHVTDDPDELPEPQRSRVLREIEEQEQRKREMEQNPSNSNLDDAPEAEGEFTHEKLPPDPESLPKSPPPNIQPTPDPQARKRLKESWEKKFSEARMKVNQLEIKCKQLENERDQAKRSSLIFARPIDREKAQNSSSAYVNCQNELEEARHTLEVELPEQARREKIPPGWLK